jgi:hypothetical protein
MLRANPFGIELSYSCLLTYPRFKPPTFVGFPDGAGAPEKFSPAIAAP